MPDEKELNEVKELVLGEWNRESWEEFYWEDSNARR